jgi:pSer/pThr/pTyr-binding forkhead associated (FHA) protein
MKFCRNCGSALGQTTPGSPAMNTLPQTPNVLPSVGKPAPVAAAMPGPQPRALGSTIACPRCGTATPVGFAYCQGCGLHIQPVAPTDPGALPPRSSANAAAIDAHGATLAAPDPRAAAAIGATLAAPDPRAAAAVGAPVPLTAPGSGPVARPSGPAVATRPSTPSAAWGTAVLVNRDGSDGQRFALTSEDILIGRAGCDIAFDDDRFLAHQHAKLSRAADGTVTITPLDTLNGVFKKTDGSVELADGAIVLVGREVLRFEKVGPEERTVHPLVRHGVALFGSPPREPWGRLFQVIPSGGHRDVRHLANDEVVLGREEGDIVFRDDAFMSRRHAALTWDGKRAQLTDLGSSNGTFVRITGATSLKHGDHVRMGDQLLRIER